MATLAAARVDGDADHLLDAQDRRKGRRNVTVAAAAAALILLIGGLAINSSRDSTDARQGEQVAAAQRDKAAGQVVSLAAQIQAECAARRLTGPICDSAARAKADPVPGAPEVPRPSTEAVSAAVAEWLTAHPPPAGPGPSTSQIAAAVTGYLVANPPTPGRPPTEGEIAAAVAGYLALNPPAPGEPGAQGEVGPGPSPEQIAAAVAAYLTENPPPPGPKGDKGDPGADSTVPGPQGPAGNPPASWTFTDAAGTTYTCTRNNRDNTAPTYSCAGQPPPTTTPSS